MKKFPYNHLNQKTKGGSELSVELKHRAENWDTSDNQEKKINTASA